MKNNSLSLRVRKSSRSLSSPGHRLLLVGIGFASLALSLAAAHAQSTKVFVASFGNDANDGSRGSPKRNFQAAHTAVAAGGEIVALDTAGYGKLTITKAVGITVPPGISGFISTDSSSGAAIVIGAPTAQVTLSGLTLNSTGPGGTGAGIDVVNVGTLSVIDCTIANFNTSAIDFSPNSAATLVVKNSTLRNCFNGVLVRINLPNSMTLALEGCLLEGNASTGLNIIEGAGGVSHRVTVRDTTFAGNGTGIAHFGASNRLTAQGCTFSANKTGVGVFTAGATARVDGCIITGNTTGLFHVAGANLLSRGNNIVEDNATDGTFSNFFAPK